MEKIATYRGKRDRVAVQLMNVNEHCCEHVKYVYFDTWEAADRWTMTINEPVTMKHPLIYLPFLYARVCR
jgi:hypothetical protein